MTRWKWRLLTNVLLMMAWINGLPRPTFAAPSNELDCEGIQSDNSCISGQERIPWVTENDPLEPHSMEVIMFVVHLILAGQIFSWGFEFDSPKILDSLTACLGEK